MVARLAVVAALLAIPIASQRADAPIRVVAAENFYGDVATQIGGAAVYVDSILSNPNQDPHLFEVSPSVARAIAGARIVVYSGADYDPWMGRLLAIGAPGRRRVIAAAALVGRRSGDNPHIWYDPATMSALAKAVAAELTAADPGEALDFARRLSGFDGSLGALRSRIAALRARWTGTPVIATEPVFGYMATALRLTMRNERFQVAVMNGTEPSASDTASFETDLRRHRVRVLLYNSQVTDDATTRLLIIARQSGVPVVGVTETEPAGMHYQDWMLRQLDALDRALSASGA